MDIHKFLREGGNSDELEQHLMDLDSTFRFKCRRCGKCCKNQETIIFTPRDIYNIAHKFGKTMEQVIAETSEVYPGHDSRMPIVHMVPRGPKNACPLLVDGRCSVHDCKPTVCALYPLGRVIWFDRTLPLEQQLDNIQVRYIANDIIRDLTANEVRVIAVYRKPACAEQYEELTYKAKKVDWASIKYPEEYQYLMAL